MEKAPQISFPFGFDERTAEESEARGYFGEAIVDLPNGARIKVCFYDPGRLCQDLETLQESGGVCIAEPCLIVIPVVTLEYMQRAVKELYNHGYFDDLLSLGKG